MPENKAKTGGLVSELHLAIGVKVMLNGARGTVQAIVKTGSEVTFVLTKFDTSGVSAKAVALSQYRS